MPVIGYEHADYPHYPGTLYDCPACENECFCGAEPAGFCIYCTEIQES